MIISLDNISSRYGLLPSEALSRASTLDITVLDIASRYDIYRNSDEYKKNKGLTQKQMLAMMEKVKNAKDEG